MKISTTLQPLIDGTRREIPSLLQHLKVGQNLQARVVEQVRPGLLKLQIANELLLARSQVSAKTGTALRLEVIKGLPLPELRIIRQPTAQEQRRETVRTAMPRQLPPREIREGLKALQPQLSIAKSGELVQQADRILRSAGIPLRQISAGRIQQALSNSGILHESRLANGLAIPSTDQKVQLLQLLTLIRPDLKLEGRSPRPTPEQISPQAGTTASAGDGLISRLIRLIEGSITRIQLQQAAALPQEDNLRQAWQIDLPIHLSDETNDAMLRIEREAAGGEDGQGASWAVNLAFDFDTIGRLQCRIALLDDRVSATFWCERPAVHQRLDRALPGLREAFEAQGLEVVHLAGVIGEPPEPLINVPRPDMLLDERA